MDFNNDNSGVDMTNDIQERLNGEHEAEPETQEQLETAYVNLKDVARPGAMLQFGKQELGLLHTILRASTEEYKELAMWRMCDFIDEDEAQDHVAAYYEAKELGMDTSFNVAFMFALCSVNRKGNRSNLIAQLTDTLQHGKWAASNTKDRSHNGVNPRSPLA